MQQGGAPTGARAADLPFIVGRWETLSLAIVRALQRSRGTGPRATIKITPAFHRRAVGNPVPRHRPRTPTLAGACPPRYDEKTPSLHVGRGPVPRHRSCARPCRAGSPDPDLFGAGTPELQRWAQCLPAYQDQEVSPTRKKSRPGGLSYRTHRYMKHPYLI